MRTFKQHIKEAHYEGDAQGVGTMDQNSIEDRYWRFQRRES